MDAVEPKGIAPLQLAFEQLRDRLSHEGLFDRSQEAAPEFPRTVGVVTSLTGAAIRDIVAVLRRRCPVVNILLAPVRCRVRSRRAHCGGDSCMNEMPQVDV